MDISSKLIYFSFSLRAILNTHITLSKKTCAAWNESHIFFFEREYLERREENKRQDRGL